MADSSAIQSIDESSLLEAALEHPFEPVDIPLSASQSTSDPVPDPNPNPVLPPESSTSSTEPDTWQSAYDAQVNEWRSQSASARTQAELTRAKWEAIRSREEQELETRGQDTKSWDHLGQHITTSTTAATDAVTNSLSSSMASLGSIEHVQTEQPQEKREQEQEVQHGKMESGSPEHRWEHISSSPTSSFPSMSFPEASTPPSPSPHHALLTHPTSIPVIIEPQEHPHPKPNPTRPPPSTIPSITDNRVAPRTRLSLILSSLTINLLLPFINGVMLGFGEIFAKDVVLGWLGWKTHSGRTAANVGLRN